MSFLSKFGGSLTCQPPGTAGTNDYICITGVQLEKGSSATPFELRSYPFELELCNRYYIQFNSQDCFVGESDVDSSMASFIIHLPTLMRTFPVITRQSASGTFPLSSPNGGYWEFNTDVLVLGISSTGPLRSLILIVPCADITSYVGLVTLTIAGTGGNAYLGISAEL